MIIGLGGCPLSSLVTVFPTDKKHAPIREQDGWHRTDSNIKDLKANVSENDEKKWKRKEMWKVKSLKCCLARFSPPVKNSSQFVWTCWREKLPQFSPIPSSPFLDPLGCRHQWLRDFIFIKGKPPWRDSERLNGNLRTSACHHQSVGASDGVTVSVCVTWRHGAWATARFYNSICIRSEPLTLVCSLFLLKRLQGVILSALTLCQERDQ